MAGYLYPFFPIVSALGFVLVLIPLPWHLEAWNSGTCYYIIWTALACLNSFINSIVWADDAINRAPVWCDICTCHTPQQDIHERSTFHNSNENNSRRVRRYTCCVHVHHAKVIQYLQYSGGSHITGRRKFRLPNAWQRSYSCTETPCSFHRFSHLCSASPHGHGPRYVPVIRLIRFF